ncbi:MAG: 3-oxoacyl-ACP synthase, partial [Acidiferrobacterales bacterium]
ALVLDSRHSVSVLGQLDIRLNGEVDGVVTTLSSLELETLRQGNPAARALPLLAAIARLQPAQVVLDYVDENRLQVAVTP